VTLRFIALTLALTALAGCRKGSPDGSRNAPAAVCAKAGDRCEFAPGKIGLCTAKPEGCDNGPCLTCVSLH
jgi:hypothetical protein